MPVPKRKHSRQRRDKKHANKGLSVQSVTTCSNCQEALMPHAACKGCGYYKGKKVLVSKDERSMKRQEVRQAKQASAKKEVPADEPEENKE